MARMHSKKRGKSKSRKPVVEIGKIPAETNVTAKQVEELIVKYAHEGMSPALIGQRLKEEHAIPYVRQFTGKRLLEILKENKLVGEIPADMMDLMRTAVRLRAHLGVHKQDKHNQLQLKRVESKLWRLARYYTRTGAMPQDWKYDPKAAELIIKGKA